MQTAYDLKDLISRFEKSGLILTEGAVKSLIADMYDWTDESIRLSATPFDNVALSILPILKDWALGAADKIDGKVDLA